MQTCLGYAARRGEPKEPRFDLTGARSRLCAKRQAGVTMDGSDRSVDGTTHQTHHVVAHRSSGGERAG
jgi:hypothetical protein